jgi:hypothetical protein
MDAKIDRVKGARLNRGKCDIGLKNDASLNGGRTLLPGQHPLGNGQGRVRRQIFSIS